LNGQNEKEDAMTPIFIISNRKHSGKTFLALGLIMKLAEMGYKAGYIKPAGRIPVKKGHGVYDIDAVFIKEALSLSEELDMVSPFVAGYEAHNSLFEGGAQDAKQRVVKALESQEDKDFVIMGGAGDIFEGASFNIDAMSLISDINASALVVEAWTGDESSDLFIGMAHLLGNRLIGGVINKVPQNLLPHVKEKVVPFLEKAGIKIFGVFGHDKVLESITVKDIAEALNGKVLCCEDKLEEFVENFSVGAMDVDSALVHFSRMPNKAVITGAHRSDIQLAAMETSTKCIILTGGFYVNDVVMGKAQTLGVPIISVTYDTFTTIDKIESVMGKTNMRQIRKIQRAKELVGAGFDIEAFISLSLPPCRP
jgi:BioD-like phosphotransacetylase family protein